MPTPSGFANAPIIKILLAYVVASAVLVSATDTKYYFNLLPVPHLFGSPQSGQWWRLLVWPLCYANSTEVLFAGMTLYQLRVVERIWGSSKMLSFLLQTLPYTVLLPPLLLLTLRLLPYTSTTLTHLPSGPTSLIFALLAQYHAAIPYTFRYRLSAVESTDEQEARSITLTSKSTSYLLPAQLALAQLPGSLIPAVVGWCVGYAWRMELLPLLGERAWRVPGWVLGDRKAGGASEGSGVEGLRRRMQEEGVGDSTGSSSARADIGSSSGRRR